MPCNQMTPGHFVPRPGPDRVKGNFLQYTNAKPTDSKPYEPGQPGANWNSDEINIVRQKVLNCKLCSA